MLTDRSEFVVADTPDELARRLRRAFSLDVSPDPVTLERVDEAGFVLGAGDKFPVAARGTFEAAGGGTRVRVTVGPARLAYVLPLVPSLFFAAVAVYLWLTPGPGTGVVLWVMAGSTAFVLGLLFVGLAVKVRQLSRRVRGLFHA